MLTNYIEDIYVQFFNLNLDNGLNIDEKDLSAARSFYTIILSENSLTEKQARLALRFLKKYQLNCMLLNFDYSQTLDSAIWKKEFRIIDDQKKVFVDRDDNGKLVVCLKFPYNLIKNFDEEITISVGTDFFVSPINYYDKDKKLKIIPIYDINLIKLYEFVIKNNFEIDQSFELLISYVEDIWQNELDVIPYSNIDNEQVVLKNCKEPVREFFEKSKSNNYYNDIFLAKTMGYPIKKQPLDIIETLCSYYENLFYVNELEKLFNITEKISGKIVILLDKSIDTEQWITDYSNVVDRLSMSRDSTKVCFREPVDYKPNFNKLIKTLGFTGNLKDAKYFIFKHKPAKWLIKDLKQVKMLVTTSAFKISNQGTEFWKGNYPCVIYLNDFKPVFGKGIDIVEL